MKQKLKKIWTKRDEGLLMSLLRIFLGAIWLMAGLEKLLNPEFMTGFAKTLEFFAGKNPNAWYVAFINSFVLPNSEVFAYVVSFGELFVGLGLISGVLANWALFFAIFMNVNFYFAAGWTSISAGSLNQLMAFVEFICLISKESKALSVYKLISLFRKG